MFGRLALIVALFATPLVLANPNSAAEAAEEEIYPLVFPVVGKVYYSDTFGACRGTNCSRSHLGTDIMTYGKKGVPVVAAHDGVVRYTSTALGRDCCAIWGITADDGWETWYIHLNNDNPYTDDGNGWGFAEGIEPGARVTAGQLIGWVGDSGNAEGTAPHLHFELRRPDGVAVPSYESLRAAERVDLDRLWGQNRFETASQIALEAFPTGASTVFVTTGRAYPDALAVGAVSASLGHPVLLTEPGSLPSTTASTLQTLDPGQIVVIGGPAAVSESVVTSLEAIAPVTRIGGIDRYDTARLVAETFFPDPEVVYIVDGYSYPEALSASVAAGTDAGPLLLTSSDVLSLSTAEYLSGLSGTRVVVVGDRAAVSDGVVAAVEGIPGITGVERVDTSDRSGVSVEISQATFPSGASTVYLATGNEYADALAGSALVGLHDAPVLLLTDAGIDAVLAEVDRLDPDRLIVLGGPAAVGYEWTSVFWSWSVGNTMPIW